MVVSDEFSFNGKSSLETNIYIVTFDDEILMEKGIPFEKNISPLDNYSQLNPMFQYEESEPEDVILNLIYMIDGIPMEWSNEKIIDVKKWLVTDYFAEFITQDNPEYKYYLQCKKIQNKMTINGIGVLECTFTPLSHFAYKHLQNRFYSSQRNINIDNPSIYDYKPIITIKNLGDKQTINKIGSIEIVGLEYNEIVTIDNLMLTVINSSGTNRFNTCNRKWITLTPGRNSLSISGNCEIEILCEYPIIL